MRCKNIKDFLSFSISDMPQIQIKFGLEISSPRFYVLFRIPWRFCWSMLNQKCIFTTVPKETAKRSSHPSLSFPPAFVSPPLPLYLILVFSLSLSLSVPPTHTQWPLRTSNCITVTLFLLWSRPYGWAYTVSPGFLYYKDSNRSLPRRALGPCFSGLLSIYYSFPPLSKSFQKSCVQFLFFIYQTKELWGS